MSNSIHDDWDEDGGSFEPIRPDDPEVQRTYAGRLRWRHPDESERLEPAQLNALVREGLTLCQTLRIDDPKEVLRFLALALILTPAQRQSPLLEGVVRRVLGASGVWSARKRLDFLYRHVVGRAPPLHEPDWGTWAPTTMTLPCVPPARDTER